MKCVRCHRKKTNILIGCIIGLLLVTIQLHYTVSRNGGLQLDTFEAREVHGDKIEYISKLVPSEVRAALETITQNGTGWKSLVQNVYNGSTSSERHNNAFQKMTLSKGQSKQLDLEEEENCTRVFPQAMIIGVSKCGTSALLEFLNLHPNVVTTSPYIEPMFFSNVRNYRKGLEFYRNQMPCSLPGQMTIEKSPQYLYGMRTPGKIYKLNKDMKIMLIVCNPVKRLISILAQNNDIIHNKITLPGNKRYNKYIESFGGKNVTLEQMAIVNKTGEVNLRWKGTSECLYERYLKYYFEVFDSKQIHIVNGEHFITDPFKELYKVESFLGLKHWYEGQQLTKNPRNENFWCLNNACMERNKGRKHPHVNETTLELFRQFYKPHNEAFYKLVNQTFNWESEGTT